MQYTQSITPHCVSAVRSRKFFVSAESTARIGRTRNAYTGIRITNKPYQLVQIRAYCAGRTIKKLANNATRSARRVGVKVMNSRKAANDTSANNKMTALRPARNAPLARMIITHQARIRAFRLFDDWP